MTEKSYEPIYVVEGTYVIENREYGFELCKVDFSCEVVERYKLQHDDMLKLLKKFTSDILKVIDEKIAGEE